MPHKIFLLTVLNVLNFDSCCLGKSCNILQAFSYAGTGSTVTFVIKFFKVVLKISYQI